MHTGSFKLRSKSGYHLSGQCNSRVASSLPSCSKVREILVWLKVDGMYLAMCYRTSRECQKTTVIKGVTIPKGAIVMIPTYLLQIDPQYWKDPEEFDPDRWVGC